MHCCDINITKQSKYVWLLVRKNHPSMRKKAKCIDGGHAKLNMPKIAQRALPKHVDSDNTHTHTYIQKREKRMA